MLQDEKAGGVKTFANEQYFILISDFFVMFVDLDKNDALTNSIIVLERKKSRPLSKITPSCLAMFGGNKPFTK